MSLDLYLLTETPIIKHKRGDSQGNYSNAGGYTRALSYEEVKKLWPGAKLDLPDPEEEYEDDEYWWANITHNLGKMASNCVTNDRKFNLYKLLWHPDENGFRYVTERYKSLVIEGFISLITHKTELEQYNPPIDPDTGERWGSYELLVDFTKNYIIALNSYPYPDVPLKIYAST